jgi:uncharacterized membrane protein
VTDAAVPAAVRMSRRDRLSLAGLAALVGGSGILHLLVPRPYRRIVPSPLDRWRPAVVVVSGVAELVCAALLLVPVTRTAGAYATAVLFVAVFPANVQMALDGGYPDASFPANNAAAAWLRLPVQAPLVWWALSLRR